MTPAERESWLGIKARAARPYIDCPPKQDGLWFRLEKPDGSAFCVPQADWPDIERLARAMTT